MPNRPRILAGMLSGICFLGSVLLLTAHAHTWEGEISTGYQSYRSDSLSADSVTGLISVRLSQIALASLEAGLELSAREDLYDRVTGAGMDLRGGKGTWNWDAGLALSKREPGELSLPLLSFDPEAMLLIEEQEQSSQTLILHGDLSRTADFHALRMGWHRSQLRYPEPDSVSSDRDENGIDAELSLYLPASLEAGIRLRLDDLSFMQRSGSDRGTRAVTLSLGRFLGDAWSLRAEADWERHSVRDAHELNSYERPGGDLQSLVFAADRFGSGTDVSSRLEWIRENWDDYEGYYRPGKGWESEVVLYLALPRNTRLELLGGLSTFDPDEDPTESWTLDRGRERRLEGSAQLAFLSETSTPMELTLLGEESRLGAEGDDRFRVLQAQLNLRWILRSNLELGLRLSLDEYQSLYEGEEAQRDLGSSGSLRLEWRPADAWRLTLDAGRSQRYSFLESGEVIEDWSLALGLRRSPPLSLFW